MKKWQWLSYPVGAFLGIWVSALVIFGSGGLSSKLAVRQTQLKEQDRQAALLRTKLAILQKADLKTETDNLSYLLQLMPATKNLPALLAEVQLAASSSGAILEEFKGKVGEVTASESARPDDTLLLQITLRVDNLDQLQRMFAQLESSLPLAKVGQISLASGRAEVTVEGLWKPLAKLPAGSQYPVTDTTALLAEIRDRLKNFSALPVASEVIDTGVNPSPF